MYQFVYIFSLSVSLTLQVTLNTFGKKRLHKNLPLPSRQLKMKTDRV